MSRPNEPCLPRSAFSPLTGPNWIHEIKHDGFHIMARREGSRVSLISRKANDLSYRFPSIVIAIAKLPVCSCLIDGEAIVCDENGLAVFNLIRGYRSDHAATLCAFDLVAVAGHDLRRKPIEERKQVLKAIV